MMFFRRLVILLVLIGALAGCPKQVRPIITGKVLSTLKKEEVVAALTSRDEELQSFRGLARVKGDSKKTPTFRQALIFKKPGSLRLEAIPLDSAFTLYLMIADDGMLTLLNPQDKEGYQSYDERTLFGRVTKLPFGVRESMSVFTGRVPSTDLNDSTEIFENTEAGEYLVKNRDFISLYTVDKSSLNLKRAEFRNQFDGTLVAVLTYTYDGEDFPSEMDLKLPNDPDNSAHFRWTGEKINEEVPAKLFEVEIPSDYKIRTLR